MPVILDGKAYANKVLAECAQRAEAIGKRYGNPPRLRIVTVGNDAASAVYVRNKKRACKQVGIDCDIERLPANATEDELLRAVTDAESLIDGCILQLPVPKHLKQTADYALDGLMVPRRDVDGLSTYNRGNWGNLEIGQKPCTALGIVKLLHEHGIEIQGQHVCIIGRSDLVGKPLAAMLTAENATVTLCHSRTRNLESYTRMADIVVVAVGKPRFFTSDMLRPGAVLIDVGINRLEDGTIVGDCTEAAYAKSGAYTPVPGGVGPVTVAMLLHNLTKWVSSDECY